MNRRNGRRRILLALPAIGWAAAIFVASSVPAEQVPAPGVAGGDKLVHVVEYAVFGLLLLLPMRDWGWRGRALAVAIGSAYALSDEFHQSLVGRFGDASDVAFDIFGLLAAIVLHAIVWPSRAAAKDEPDGSK